MPLECVCARRRWRYNTNSYNNNNDIIIVYGKLPYNINILDSILLFADFDMLG